MPFIETGKLLASVGTNPGWPNSFDFRIEQSLNQFALKSPFLNGCMSLLVRSFLFRGGVLLSWIWYVLFDSKRPGQLRKGAELLVGTMLLSILYMPVVRIVAYLLPFRARPIATPALHFVLPVKDVAGAVNWSAFPSDHALLFSALATGIFFVSRRAGILAYLWVAIAICLPRLYVGFHWPTDILAGAVLGVALASVSLVPGFRRWTKRVICSQYTLYPAPCYAILFLYTFGVGTQFADAFNLITAIFGHGKT